MAAPSGGATPTGKKEDSFLDKFGTLAKKKRNKQEIEELQTEGRNAIEAPLNPAAPEINPEGYQLSEGEERSMISPDSKDDEKVRNLTRLLLDWINNVLVDQRIIVRDIQEDLFDGQILQKLYESLMGTKLPMAEVTQTEMGQKQKLRIILEEINRALGITEQRSYRHWTVELIHSKDLVAILRLLVGLARHFRAPIRLPAGVNIQVVRVRKLNGRLTVQKAPEVITEVHEEMYGAFERDAFDTLFEKAPEKLDLVKKSLQDFANKHLGRVNLEITDLDTQMNDGVYLVLLMGLLEGYFVPLFHYHLTPESFEQKVHNVQLSFDLMEEAGMTTPKARPEDIVNGELKATLRVLFALFTRHKESSTGSQSGPMVSPQQSVTA